MLRIPHTLLLLSILGLLIPTQTLAQSQNCCDYSQDILTGVFPESVLINRATGECVVYKYNCLNPGGCHPSAEITRTYPINCPSAQNCLANGTVPHVRIPGRDNTKPKYVCTESFLDPGQNLVGCKVETITTTDGAGRKTTLTRQLGIQTALGCIDIRPESIVQTSVQLGIWVGSGIAFLQIILSSWKIISSQGNPDAINSGKDTLTAAIVGLLFIILSVTILQTIGFDILGLGAFGLGTR